MTRLARETVAYQQQLEAARALFWHDGSTPAFDAVAEFEMVAEDVQKASAALFAAWVDR